MSISAPGFAEGTYKQPNDFPRIGSPGTETIGRRSWDAGFNIGGPFIQNKFFWYGSFNPSFSIRVRQGPVNYGTRTLGPQTRESKSYNWVGKVNYNITDAHRLEATAFGDPSRWPIAGQRHAGARRCGFGDERGHFGTRNWAVKYNGCWVNSTLLNATFSWNHGYFEETPQKNLYAITDYSKPKPTGTSTATGGAGIIGNSQGDSKQYAWMLTHNANVLGSHQIDLGYAYNHVNYDAERYYTGPVWNLPASPGVAAADVGKPVQGGLFFFYPTRTVAGVAYTNVYRQSRGNFGEPAVRDHHHVPECIRPGRLEDQQVPDGQAGRALGAAAHRGPGERLHVRRQLGSPPGLYHGSDRFAQDQDLRQLGPLLREDPAGHGHARHVGRVGILQSSTPPLFLPRRRTWSRARRTAPYAVDATVWAAGTKAMYQTEIVGGVERELPAGMVVSATFHPPQCEPDFGRHLRHHGGASPCWRRTAVRALQSKR